MDYDSINQSLKGLRAQHQKLDEARAAAYVKTLSHSITGPNDLSRVNSIVVLAKAMNFLPKSDRVFSLFDTKLFASMCDAATRGNVADSTVESILRIFTVYLSGSFAETRSTSMYDPLLWNACNNHALFEVLSARLAAQDAQMASTVVDFAAQIMYRSFEVADASVLLQEVKCIMDCHLLDVVSSLPYELKAHLDGFSSLRKSSLLLMHFLTNSSLKSKAFSGLVNECIISMTRMMAECGMGEANDKNCSADYCMVGLAENIDPQQYLQDNFTPAVALDLLYMLKNPNMTFKKNFSEHTMFASMQSYFPLFRFASAITQMLSNVDGDQYPNFSMVFTYMNGDLYYSFMSSALKYWMASKAEARDFDRLMNLLHTLLVYCDDIMRAEPYYNVTDHVINLKYAPLKKFQLEHFRQNKDASWSGSMTTFDKVLDNQVMDFVKNQRFFELSKGSWVFIHNPLDKTPPSGKPVYYFVTISSDNRSLVYKEFTRKHSHTPNIDKDGVVVEFKNITKVDHKTISENFRSNKLISISSRLNVSRIEITSKNGKVFKFFVDTKGKLVSWLDGLKMLMNDDSSLSDDTINQIQSLKKIRARIQLIDLQDNSKQKAPKYSYDPSDLSKVASGFFYD